MMEEYKRKQIHQIITKQKRAIYGALILFMIIFLLLVSLILNKPFIKLNGAKTLELKIGEKYQEPGVKVTTLLGNSNKKVSITGNVDTLKAGTYQIHYQVQYMNATISKYRTVKVNDTIAPTLELNGDEVVYVVENTNYEEPGYQAIDNNDGNITKKVKVTNNVDTKKIGTYHITYQVKDQANNKVEKKRTVIVVKKQDPNIKTIYLTFDDGPSSVTPKILDVLKKENVKATFFMIGKDDSYNDIIKRVKKEGHTVAIHSNTHDYEQIYTSVDNYFNDLYALRDKLKKITSEEATIIRFPGGSSNTVSRFNSGIMTTITKEVTRRGFRYFDWNIDSGDTGRIGSDAIVENVTSQLGSYHTYVVLMHDYWQNQQTADALERIIHYGKEHGYHFDRITNSTPLVQHSVNN